MRTKIFIVGIVALVFSVATFLVHAQGKEYKELTYAIVGTGQLVAYDDHGPIPMPDTGSDFFGQDATNNLNAPNYLDNGNGTVTDLVTGLTWKKST